MENDLKMLSEFIGVNIENIRLRKVGNVPYYHAEDICKAFHIENFRAVIDEIDAEGKKVIGGEIYLDEGGLNELYFEHCKLPQAENFRNWLFGKVVPEIIETGSYGDKKSVLH